MRLALYSRRYRRYEKRRCKHDDERHNVARVGKQRKIRLREKEVEYQNREYGRCKTVAAPGGEHGNAENADYINYYNICRRKAEVVEKVAYASAESEQNGGYKRIAKTELLLTACRAARRIRGLAFVWDYIYVYIGRKLTQAIDYALF